jgi:hypothetical protein
VLPGFGQLGVQEAGLGVLAQEPFGYAVVDLCLGIVASQADRFLIGA